MEYRNPLPRDCELSPVFWDMVIVVRWVGGFPVSVGLCVRYDRGLRELAAGMFDRGSGARGPTATREQELEERVRRLEAQVAYLKKSMALKAERGSRTGRRP